MSRELVWSLAVLFALAGSAGARADDTDYENHASDDTPHVQFNPAPYVEPPHGETRVIPTWPIPVPVIVPAGTPERPDPSDDPDDKEDEE
jgi:hypothetical protein